ncbi:MAG TPA: M20/M25/M40 family metallo-hydrolase [Candidatus Acetothermia bacterium]|nr:M20/M25/M40 family metallo-hydrolase [Candidatus Acetothermia bacterium]
METIRSEHSGVLMLDELLGIPAPSGWEGNMAAEIGKRVSPLGWTYRNDAAGNVLVDIPGSNPQGPVCCLAAHMDEIGMTVTNIDPDGRLRIDRSGGLYPWKLGEGPVEVFARDTSIPGLLSFGSTHVPNAGERKATWDEASILTGVNAEQLAKLGVGIGNPVLPVRERRGPFLFGSEELPWVGAWTLDNRMGIIALLQLLEEIRRQEIVPHCPTLVAFTVEEEIGGYGAKFLAQREQPEVLIAVDGCPVPPGAPLQLDGRPGIRTKDRAAIYDPYLLDDICRLAKRAGVGLQPVAYTSSASDASLAHVVGVAPRIASVGYVRESSHGYDATPIASFDNLLATLLAFIRNWKG